MSAILLATLKKSRAKVRFCGTTKEMLALIISQCSSALEMLEAEKHLERDEAIKFILDCINEGVRLNSTGEVRNMKDEKKKEKPKKSQKEEEEAYFPYDGPPWWFSIIAAAVTTILCRVLFDTIGL